MGGVLDKALRNIDSRINVLPSWRKNMLGAMLIVVFGSLLVSALMEESASSSALRGGSILIAHRFPYPLPRLIGIGSLVSLAITWSLSSLGVLGSIMINLLLLAGYGDWIVRSISLMRADSSWGILTSWRESLLYNSTWFDVAASFSLL
jgi:hypothetical protein